MPLPSRLPTLAALFASLLAAPLLAATLSPPAVAQTSPVPQLAQADRPTPAERHAETIAGLERYLRSIDTLVSRFTQVSSDGAYAQGQLWLDRPGKMRFEYDEPVPVLMIANGLELLYYDRELQQPTFLPLWETPLWMVLKEEASLTDEIEVLGLREAGGEIEVRVRESDHPDRGQLTLRFEREPLQLKGWTVIDAQGVATEVTLVDPRWGVQVADERFESRDLPNVGLEDSRNR
jgi:outer membrane lipoprotein-sorting protein